MADIVSHAVRARMMSGIKGKDTSPELTVRRMLHAKGYRFRLHRKDLPGTPDIAMPGRKVAIFVHGCFWHAHAGCKFAKLPSTRQDFWKKKLLGNVERDQRATVKLLELGWRVLCVWECALRDANAADRLPGILSAWIEGLEDTGEVRGPLA